MEKRDSFADLRPVQYQDVYHADDHPLIDVSKSAARWTAYFLTAVMLLLIFLGANVKLARYVTYKFVLEGSEQGQVYRFFDAVYLEQKYGSVGREVLPGDPLLRIRSPQIVNLINSYETSRERQKLFEGLGASLYADKSAAALLEKEKAAKKRDEAEKQAEKVQKMYENELDKQKFLVEGAKRRYQVEQELFAEGVSSRLDVDKAKEELMLAEHQVKAIKENYEKELLQLRSQMEVSDIDQAMSRNDYSSGDREMRNQRELLKREAELAYQKILQNYGNVSIENGSLVFKASTKGTISYLLDSEKDIPAGTVIMKITGEGDTLYASASIPPDKIGLVKEGARVVLKVATFPHYEWGAVEGRIQTMSLTPDEKGEYPIRVEITNAGKLKGRLQSGMNGEVSIPVEEKSFFGYIFEKVRKGYHAMTE
jgi:multidrug efflux pump subunit AcrA (membrane-fusion protein)